MFSRLSSFATAPAVCLSVSIVWIAFYHVAAFHPESILLFDFVTYPIGLLLLILALILGGIPHISLLCSLDVSIIVIEFLFTLFEIGQSTSSAKEIVLWQILPSTLHQVIKSFALFSFFKYRLSSLKRSLPPSSYTRLPLFDCFIHMTLIYVYILMCFSALR